MKHIVETGKKKHCFTTKRGGGMGWWRGERNDRYKTEVIVRR
jgi:hypothetical protein